MRRPGDLALVGRVLVENAVHHGGAAGVGQQLRLVAEQAARRRIEHHAGPAAARWAHLEKFALALRQLRYDDAGVAVIDVDDNLLDRLQPLTVVAVA